VFSRHQQPNSQIDIVNTQLLQAGVQCCRDIGNVRQYFGHDVEFLARLAGLFNSYAELSFSFVDFGTVKVVVA